MEPFQRFKNLNTDGNLWIYVLALGKDGEVQDGDVARLVFEKYGFLPGNLLVKSVLFRLRGQGYIKTDKLKGKRSYITTAKGAKELEKMIGFYKDLLQKI